MHASTAASSAVRAIKIQLWDRGAGGCWAPERRVVERTRVHIRTPLPATHNAPLRHLIAPSVSLPAYKREWRPHQQPSCEPLVHLDAVNGLAVPARGLRTSAWAVRREARRGEQGPRAERPTRRHGARERGCGCGDGPRGSRRTGFWARPRRWAPRSPRRSPCLGFSLATHGEHDSSWLNLSAPPAFPAAERFSHDVSYSP